MCSQLGIQTNKDTNKNKKEIPVARKDAHLVLGFFGGIRRTLLGTPARCPEGFRETPSPSSIPTAQPDCWGRMEPVIPSLEEPKQLCNQKGSYLHSGALPEVSSIAPFEEKAGFGCRAEGRRRAPPGDKQPQENRTVAVTRKVPSDDVTGAPSAKAIVQPRSPPPPTLPPPTHTLLSTPDSDPTW